MIYRNSSISLNNCFDIISKEIRKTKERDETLDYIRFILSINIIFC